MLNSCVLNPKVDLLSSHSCDCALDAMTSGFKGLHTPIRGLVRSVLSLQHKIYVLQVRTERCRNLAMGLRVGQLCSTIQLSPLSGWPRRSTKRWCGTPWQFTSHPGGPLHGVSWTIQAPSPCNHPPSMFGTWAASTHGRLLGTIQYVLKICVYLQCKQQNPISLLFFLSFHFSVVCRMTNDTPPYFLQSVLIMTSGLLEEQHPLRDVLSCAGTRAGALCVMTFGVLQMQL